ncbi:hypothetical protein [Leifsonia sp. NCR5]|uniref:hypothetical protein n=1 Tax=Leifsonia sp. NCR5 TaxID=1978342 RepID=UPI000A197D88|nr:hypothetical protein [Leifsonia sp. NCR5]
MKRSAVSVLGAVAVAVVLTLSGCAQGAPAAPVATTAKPTTTPTPTATQAAAPTVRVATTCDALATQALVDQAGGAHLVTSTPERTATPTGYADERMGVLTCQWSTTDPASPTAPAVWIAVVPGASRAGFEAYRTGEAVASQDTPSPVGPDAYTYCFGTPVTQCGFHALLPGYGIVGTVFGSDASPDAATSAVAALLAQSYGVVSALDAPAPVWQPAAPALRGATTCDGLATTAQLTQTIGFGPSREVKSDDGEYSNSKLDVGHQVGAYWCVWVEDDGTASVSVGVLPGGATYLEHLRGSDAVEQPGVGQAAYWAPNGYLNIVVDSGWLQVHAVPDGKDISHEQLVALAKQVIANLGTT